MFVGAMDLAIINVALPTLSRVFHASNASVQWTVIAYVLSLAMSTTGLVLLTAVIGSMATIDAQTSIWTVRAVMFMAGAALSTVVASVGGESFAAFHAAYAAAALIALTGSVTAFTLIHDGDARATMVRREDPPAGDSARLQAREEVRARTIRKTSMPNG